MTKVVINKCFGGFTLSKKAVEWLEERGVFNTPDLQEELKRTKAWMKQTLDSYNPNDGSGWWELTEEELTTIDSF